MNVLDDRLREHFEKAGTMPAPPLDPDAPVQRARRRRRNRTAAVAVSAILAVVGLAGLISSLAADDEGATRTVDEPDVPEDEPEDAGPEPATITVPESISPSIAGDFPVGSWPFDVAASDKLLVAVGTDQAFCCGTYIDGQTSDSASAAVWTSIDGVNWIKVPHDESVFGGPGGQGMYSVTATPDGFVAGGIDGGQNGGDAAVWTSPDGLTWSRVPDPDDVLGGPEGQSISTLAYSTSLGLVAHGGDGGNAAGGVWTSNDGSAWTRAPRPGLNLDGAGEIVAAPSGFTAFGANVWESTDGVTWTLNSSVSELPFRTSAVFADGDGYAAIEEFGNSDFPSGQYLWRSADGLEWVRDDEVSRLAVAPSGMKAITAFNGGYIGVGLGGQGDFHGVAGPVLIGESPPASANTAPTSDSGLISPDRWTFAVVIGDASSDAAAQVVDEVREWEGVIDIVQVPATWEAWNAVTGRSNIVLYDRADICGPGSICGEGFVILVADDDSVARIRPQLEQRDQFLDVWTSDAYYQQLADEYVGAMSELQGPPEPTFDTADLGVEQILVDRRTVEAVDEALLPFHTIDGVLIPPADQRMWLGVARLEAAGATAAWSLIEHPENPNAAPLLSLSIGTSGSGSGGFEFPGFPPHFIIAIRDGDRHSVATVGGLPPHTSVVATTLSDGTRIWQRPISGLVIFDTFPDVAPTFTVLDADGQEILSVVVGADNLYQIIEPGEVAD